MGRGGGEGGGGGLGDGEGGGEGRGGKGGGGGERGMVQALPFVGQNPNSAESTSPVANVCPKAVHPCTMMQGPSTWMLLRQAQGVQLQEHEPAPEGLRGQHACIEG